LGSCLRYCVLLAICAVARAQEFPVSPDTPLPDYARRDPPPHRGGGPVFIASTNGLPNVLLTGYWPPTNEMLRQFSRNLDQNPGGWVGENWEGRGYNVYAYFPEFPAGFGQGDGDFEVDYQDTSSDWWALLPQINPIAIITFSRASNNLLWEPEGGNRTYALSSWTNDYLDPFKPTPELPIASETPLTERFSTLPIAEIMHNVATSGAAVVPISSVLDTGRFLSNFIGYHGDWYHDLHPDVADPNWVVCAGHVHVGYAMELADAVLATEVTVRTLLTHVDERRALVLQGDLNGDGAINLIDYSYMAACAGGPVDGSPPAGCDSSIRFALADLSADGLVDLLDLAQFAHALVALAEPPLALPFEDTLATTTFDPARWALVASATIDDVGINEPSPPYAARFNKSPTTADKLESRPIDTRSTAPVHLRYAWQRRGGGASPAATDDLLVEYHDAVGAWRLLAVHLGDGPDMTTFEFADHVLPPEALHHQFRVRFRSAFGAGTTGDDWFVDDVSITTD
jgi:hypothetical protein